VRSAPARSAGEWTSTRDRRSRFYGYLKFSFDAGNQHAPINKNGGFSHRRLGAAAKTIDATQRHLQLREVDASLADNVLSIRLLDVWQSHNSAPALPPVTHSNTETEAAMACPSVNQDQFSVPRMYPETSPVVAYGYLGTMTVLWATR
jgi:hypothetical protein